MTILLQNPSITFSNIIDSADQDAFNNAILNHMKDFLTKEGYTIKLVSQDGANIRDRMDGYLLVKLRGKYTITEKNKDSYKNNSGYKIETGKFVLGGNLSLGMYEPVTNELIDSIDIDLASFNIEDSFSKATKVGSGDLLFGMFDSNAEDDYNAKIISIINLSYPKITREIDFKISKQEFDTYKSHIETLKAKKSF